MPGSPRGGPGAVLRRTRFVLRGEVAARNRWLLDPGLRSAETRGSPYLLASSTTTSARARVPAARSAGEARSASLWLMPRAHGTKIMHVGHSPARCLAACEAPETMSAYGSECHSAAARTRPATTGLKAVGGECKVSATSTAHPRACARHTASTRSPRQIGRAHV